MWLPIWVFDGNGFTMVNLAVSSKLLVARPPYERCFGIKAQDSLSRGRREVLDETGRHHERRGLSSAHPLLASVSREAMIYALETSIVC
jgi:hypothetical protein